MATTYSLGKFKIQYLKKFEYFLKDQSKKDLQNRNVQDLQSRFNYALNTLGLLLQELLLQCGMAWRRSACGTAEALLKPRLL